MKPKNCILKMKPENYSLKMLIGKSCPLDRNCCLFSPTRWFESQHPENFELYLSDWEERGQELLDL